MESVYNPKSYICTDKISLKDFLWEASNSFILPRKIIETFDNKTKNCKEINEFMNIGLDEESLERLAEQCSPDHLNGKSLTEEKNDSDMKTTFTHVPITSEALKFNTVNNMKNIRKEPDKYHNLWLKYRGIKCLKKLIDDSNPGDLVPGSEILIRIRVYHPFKHNINKDFGKTPKFYHDLVVLGSQTLDVLRDKIICSNDLSCTKDYSQKPNTDIERTFKDIFKSSFLFIDNTFYNDFRDPSNIDYSKCIRDWALNRKDIGPFNTGQMERTTFNELQVRLGYPLVYQHLGYCEHLFTFSDVEILQPSDICQVSKYPMYNYLTVGRARYCYLCGLYVAKWILEKSQRTPFDPAYFCNSCFHSYNYIDGRPVENFKATPYFDSVNAI